MINIDLIKVALKKSNLKIEPGMTYTFNIDNRYFASEIMGTMTFDDFAIKRNRMKVSFTRNMEHEYHFIIMSLGIESMTPEFTKIFYNDFIDFFRNYKANVLKVPVKYWTNDGYREAISQEFFIREFEKFYTEFIEKYNCLEKNIISEFSIKIANILKNLQKPN